MAANEDGYVWKSHSNDAFVLSYKATYLGKNKYVLTNKITRKINTQLK